MTCPHCGGFAPTRRLWLMERGERKAIQGHAITLLRAVDKVVELWAGMNMVGTLTSIEGHYPPLAEVARKLGGHWVQVHRAAWARVDAIESWYPRGESGGADLRVAGVQVEASRRCWRYVRTQIALS
jgi:hypothetical protein